MLKVPLKLTYTDMKSLKIVDEVIQEPVGGAHRFREETFANVSKSIQKNLDKLSKMDPQMRVNKRIEKFCEMGVFKGK